MHYFKNINCNVLDFIQPSLNKKYSVDTNDHFWIELPIEKCLTPEGFNWFIQRGFELRPTALLFKALSNTHGPLHVDNTEYGFNFIVHGDRVMQWYDTVQGDLHIEPTHLDVGWAYSWDTNVSHRVFTNAQNDSRRIHLVLGFSPWWDYLPEEQAWVQNEFYGVKHPFDMLADGDIMDGLHLDTTKKIY